MSHKRVREVSSAPYNKSASTVRSMKGSCWTFESFASQCTYPRTETFCAFQRVPGRFSKKKVQAETFEKRTARHLRIRTFSTFTSVAYETSISKSKYTHRIDRE